MESKGVGGGVERRRDVSGLKPRGSGRRDAPAKVLKDRRSPRQRGRMGTSTNANTPGSNPTPGGQSCSRAPSPCTRGTASAGTGAGRSPRA
eukprot:31435-Pelagococcus_subviridis.AAC.3